MSGWTPRKGPSSSGSEFELQVEGITVDTKSSEQCRESRGPFSFFTDICKEGTRLERRKFLWRRLREVNNYACIIAFVGFLLMIVEVEMIVNDVYTRKDLASFYLKSVISASTLLLVVFIFHYHRIQIEINLLHDEIDRQVINHLNLMSR